MSEKHVKDLTAGSPMKLILSFMLPLLFGLLFQLFYSMVDTVVVGKLLGVQALAGVGSTGSISFLVLGLCNVFDLLRRRGKLGSVYCFTAVCLALFPAYYPALSGLTMSRNYAWYFLKWFPSWPF